MGPFGSTQGRRGRPKHPDILTPREWEVLALVRDGLTNAEIAERLGITLAGARYHVSEILSKLGVATREEAAAWEPRAAPSRRWSLATPLAKVALGATAVAMLAGMGVLAWGVLREGGTGEELSVAAQPSPSKSPVATRAPAPTPIPPTPLPVAIEPYVAAESVPRCGDILSEESEPGIYLLGMSDCAVRRITDGDYDSPTDWGPDGTMVFVRSDGLITFSTANSEIYMLPPGASDPVALTDTPAVYEYDPNLSPDGSMLAYLALSLGQVGTEAIGTNRAEWVRDLVVAPIDSPGEAVTILSVRGGLDFDWSPDSSSLVVTTFDRRVVVVAVSGGPELVIATDDSGVWSATWSPRGDWIAYSCTIESETPRFRDMCLVSPDGRNKVIVSALVPSRRALPTASGADRAFWSEDGSHLFFGFDFELLSFAVDRVAIDYVLQGGGGMSSLLGDGRGIVSYCARTASPCPLSEILAVNLSTGATDSLLRIACGLSLSPVPGGEALAVSVPAEGFCGL